MNVRILSSIFFSFSELCWGKAMVAYTMPQQRKKEEESERLREREIRSTLSLLHFNLNY